MAASDIKITLSVDVVDPHGVVLPPKNAWLCRLLHRWGAWIDTENIGRSINFPIERKVPGQQRRCFRCRLLQQRDI